jgi:D-alanine-D-alanine ligase
MTTVLVLGGGPDAEREVSLNSSKGVAEALRAGGRYGVEYRTIDRISLAELKALPGDCIFPVLHGAFGEGGPLQDLMEADGRPYIGCRPRAARLAMDKLASKLAAARAGIPTAESCVMDVRDDACPLPFPVVVKPVHDGSSVGLHIVHCGKCWSRALPAVREDVQARPGRAYMIERFIPGKELTVGLLDGQPLPIIHIQPADGPYDYEAKYTRGDTRYHVDPDLPEPLKRQVQEFAAQLARSLGVRHVARVDFLLDSENRPWLLEINTMPGFTATSLVPKAAHHSGMEMPELCAKLVGMALRDHASGAAHAEVEASACG